MTYNKAVVHRQLLYNLRAMMRKEDHPALQAAELALISISPSKKPKDGNEPATLHIRRNARSFEGMILKELGEELDEADTTPTPMSEVTTEVEVTEIESSEDLKDFFKELDEETEQ